MLDLLTQGRVIFGLGHGSPADMEHTGLSQAEKHQMFRQQLIEVLDYLSPQRQGSKITPPPREGLGQLFWLGVRDHQTITLAAQLGLNLLVGQGEGAIAQNIYSDIYRQAGGTGALRGFRLVYVGQTDTEAQEAIAEPAKIFFSVREKLPAYIEAQRQGRIGVGSPKDLSDMLNRMNYIVGSPATVAKKLNEYIGATKVDHLGVKIHLLGLANKAVRQAKLSQTLH